MPPYASTANTPVRIAPIDAADRMHAECVERVVIAEHVLETGAAPVADDAGRRRR